MQFAPLPGMGRNRGFDGPELARDVATGEWATREYEVNASEVPPNTNWFFVADFVARVSASQPGTSDR